jgi:hypothetical protein
MSQIVKLIRLTSGEEVIAKIVEETNGGYQVKNPTILLPAGQGRIALVPWLPYSESENMFIPEKIIGFVVVPKDELIKEYTSMTSGLILPSTKTVSTPKLTLVE